MKNKISTVLSRTVVIVIVLFLVFANQNIFAEFRTLKPEQVAEIVNSTQRTVVPLSGVWEKSNNNGNTWQRVNIPKTSYENEQIIYKKEVRIDKDLVNNKNIRLLFLGLAGQVEIYFNNDFLIKVDGKFIPLDITVPRKMLIPDGNNEIKLVFLKNSEIDFLHTRSILNAPKLAKGIIRETFLIATSPIYVSELKYQFTNNLNNLQVDLTCAAEIISDQILAKDETTGTVATKRIRVSAEYQLFNKRTNEAVTPLETKDFFAENARTENLKFNISTNHLNRWSLESPELYKLVVRLRQNGVLIDEYFTNIGKKNISKNNDKQITVNGQPLEIKAITYNETFGTNGNTVSDYRLAEDIKNIKLLGANAIRLKNFVPNPYLMHLCDKYGIMVFIDLPLLNTNRSLLQREEFLTQTENSLLRILQSYSNFTSFVGIGIGSSVIEGKEFENLAKQLISLTKDYRKLIYKTVELGTNNFNFEGFDFLILQTNNSFRSEENIRNEIERIKKICNLPLILGFSSRVKPGNMNGYSDPTSNEFQAFFIKNCYNISVQMRLAGSLINSYNDYFTNFPVLTLNYWNQFMETTGITDIYHRNKPAVATVKALFNDERLPLLNAGTYENKTPITYILTGLMMLLFLVLMFNRYSRFREYFIRAFWRPENFFADIRDLRILSMKQTLVLGLIITSTLSLCFGSVIFNFRNDINYSFLFVALLPFINILEVLFKSVWRPELLLAFFTVFNILVLLVVAFLVRILAAILRARLFTADAITITIWSALPLVIFLPLSVILAKLVLLSDAFIFIFFVLFILTKLWTLHRFFKALSIIFAKQFIQIYSFGIIFLVLTVILPIVFYENKFDLLPFVEYFIWLP